MNTETRGRKTLDAKIRELGDRINSIEKKIEETIKKREKILAGTVTEETANEHKKALEKIAELETQLKQSQNTLKMLEEKKEENEEEKSEEKPEAGKTGKRGFRFLRFFN